MKVPRVAECSISWKNMQPQEPGPELIEGPCKLCHSTQSGDAGQAPARRELRRRSAQTRSFNVAFSIGVKDTRKLRVQKCWNLQLSQRQLRDTQFNGKATTISLASRIILLEEGGDRHCLESGK